MDGRFFSLPLELIQEFGTNDPFTIAEGLKKYNGKPVSIAVRYFDAKKQKGFCTNILNNYFIFINQNLSCYMRRMVCGHELGHILFHQDKLGRDENGRLKKLVEWELFDIKDRTEYEANLFLANLLIDTDSLKELVYQGADIVSIASRFCVNVNLVAIKLAETKYDNVRLPFIPEQNFLGKIEDCCHD